VPRTISITSSASTTTVITAATTIIAATTTTTTAPKASAEERKRIATGRQVRRGGRGALGFAIIASTIMILHGHWGRAHDDPTDDAIPADAPDLADLIPIVLRVRPPISRPWTFLRKAGATELGHPVRAVLWSRFLQFRWR
jgi:hypothetical protein